MVIAGVEGVLLYCSFDSSFFTARGVKGLIEGIMGGERSATLLMVGESSTIFRGSFILLLLLLFYFVSVAW